MWKVWVQAAGLILLALGSAWLLSLLEKTAAPEEQELSHDPDFYMEDFTTVRMDAKGRPKQEISARRLEHYPDTDTNELESPRMVMHGGPGTQPWQVQAERGWVSADQDVILLTGAVRILKPGVGGQPELEIETRDMRLKLKDDYAETDSQVIIRTPAGETRSVGMRAYLKERRLKLLSQVRTRYETNTAP